MWKLPVQVLGLVLLGNIYAQDNDLQEDADTRLNRIEELLTSQIASQESLRAALRQETGRRLELEMQMKTSLEEQRASTEELSSAQQVLNDRVVALDGTLQDEIKLREEAEINAAEVILQMSKKITLVERDLSLLSLLNSRLRDLENQKGVQNEEIRNLQSTITQLRKSFTRERREIQEVKGSIEPLASIASEHTKSLTNYDHRINQLKSWLISHNETTKDEGIVLQEVKDDVIYLTETLTDIQVSIVNLTESVIYLHHLTPTRLLKLCPSGYRKVGKDCLQLIESRSTWEEARLKCEELGIMAGGIGDLAVPTSVSEFRAFVDKLDAATDYLWVGAKRDDDNVWRWISGTSMDEKEVSWDLGEPDNYENQFHLCVRSAGNIKFHDCIVESSLGAVCQLV